MTSNYHQFPEYPKMKATWKSTGSVPQMLVPLLNFGLALWIHSTFLLCLSMFWLGVNGYARFTWGEIRRMERALDLYHAQQGMLIDALNEEPRTR